MSERDGKSMDALNECGNDGTVVFASGGIAGVAQFPPEADQPRAEDGGCMVRDRVGV